jgi:MFS family permease
MQKYLHLLRGEPVLRRLTLIQLIAYFAAWFSNVAIYTLLVQLDANPGLIALTAALHFLPGVIQAPLGGVLIDRFSPKRLMLFVMLLEIASTLPLMLVNDLSQLWLLFVMVFIRMGAASFYFTLEMSLLPKILSGGNLKLANEIHSVVWSLSYTLGMAISGLVVYMVGVKTAFLLDAMLFVVGVLLLLPLVLPERENVEERQSFLQTFKEGFGYIKHTPVIKHLILLHAFVGFTAFDALVAMMVDTFYAPAVATALAIGLLHAFRALGLVIGPLLLGRWMNNERLAYLLLFQGVAIIAWAMVIESFLLSLIASVFVGLATTTLWSYTYTLLQIHTDKQYYGRVVSYNDMMFLLTVAAISMVIGALAEAAIPLSVITALLGTLFIGGMLYYAWIRNNFTIKEVSHDL